MKKMKFTICALFAALTFLVLPSCSDDDDNNGPGGSKEDLIGLWQTTHIKGWEKTNGVITDRFDDDDTEFRYEFKSDGTCINYEYNSNTWNPQYGTYTYSNGTLTINYGGGYVETAKVKKLTSTTAEVEITYSGTYDGDTYEGYRAISLRKISGEDAW